jgi:hypothetical protein
MIFRWIRILWRCYILFYTILLIKVITFNTWCTCCWSSRTCITWRIANYNFIYGRCLFYTGRTIRTILTDLTISFVHAIWFISGRSFSKDEVFIKDICIIYKILHNYVIFCPARTKVKLKKRVVSPTSWKKVNKIRV